MDYFTEQVSFKGQLPVFEWIDGVFFGVLDIHIVVPVVA
jgi:hypothetical protein